LNADPYAPPAANVADIHELEVAPPLWNPNAAANWSLLFSPAFGAWLHMKNWRALGDEPRARANLGWFIATIVILVGAGIAGMLLPESRGLDAATRSLGIGLLAGWYVSSARHQAKVVKERFGTAYPRRGWAVPILVAIGAIFAILVFLLLVAILLGLGEA
jgi:hypothetical protein